MGRSGYWIGGLIMVVGSLAAIVLFVVAVGLEPEPDFASVTVPGDRQVTMEARQYWLFDEHPIGEEQDHGPPSVRITGPNGDEPITPTDGLGFYVGTERSGTEFATIRPSVAGTYRVQVTADPARLASQDERVTIGEPAGWGGFVVAIVLGFVTFVAGLAVIIATAVSRLGRSNSSRTA